MTFQYSIVNEIANNSSFRNRIVGCVSSEQGLQEDPRTWVDRNILRISSNPDIAGPWQYAEDQKTVNVNPDTGARTDVISDQVILSVVQSIMNASSS